MRSIAKHLSLAATLAVASVLAAPASAADAYPSKPVRIVVPYAPGGGADLLARAVGQMLGTMWKQPVVVENRPGAGGSLGTENVARSQADGYSLLMASPGHTINPALYHNLSFDAVKDFRAIGMVASGPLVLVVNPSNPANTMKEFIDQARAKPGTVNYASAGIGSSPHLAGELLKMMAGIDLVHVPYKGTSPALTDLLGGQVQAMFAPVPTVIEYVKAGKLKALAVTSPTPFPAMPTVPPVAATVPKYEVLQWWGLVTPKGTPQAIIDKINHDVATVLKDPTMRQRLDVMGAEPGGQAPAQLDTLIADEIVKWNDVVKTANIQAQ
jgi:tripartite-type tricarboxylate transporter receptor subunit TctC